LKLTKGMMAACGAALALCFAALLTGCATEAPPPPPAAPNTPPVPAPVAGWEAAIGELDIGQPGFHCSAILVASNVIVTASHCLTVAAQNARPLAFSPAHGGGRALPPSEGVALKWGARVSSGNIRSEDVPLDWAVIEINPPVRSAQPLPVASLSLDQMLGRVASGARVVVAGYGASDTLNERGECRLLSQAELGLYPDDSWLKLDCRIQSGDSGGAIVLLDGRKPWLIGIIAGWGRNPKLPGRTIALGANARNFAPYVRIPVAEAGAGALLVAAVPRAAGDFRE
jgi:V8-like Glu-specific endopeptidase